MGPARTQVETVRSYDHLSFAERGVSAIVRLHICCMFDAESSLDCSDAGESCNRSQDTGDLSELDFEAYRSK